ncbi:MAG: TatD family hydrolase [Oscillospiraceae bacterium]|nr:TatD family hydrolase [Oscillospiraceae bacterium]
MIDTHAHYHHRRFDSDRERVLEKIHTAGVSKVIEVPISLESNADVLRLCEKYPWMYPALGVHPNQTVFHDINDDNTVNTLKNLFAEHSTVALGEIGLDYYRITEDERRAHQRAWFARLIALGLEVKKPIILHVREAARDALDILESFRCSFSGVVHCYSEDKEVSKRYMDIGFALGVGGSLTHDAAENVREAVKYAPLDMLLLETDAPFLTPAGCEGKNDSANLPVVISLMAQLKGMHEEEIIRQTTKNAEDIFGI